MDRAQRGGFQDPVILALGGEGHPGQAGERHPADEQAHADTAVGQQEVEGIHEPGGGLALAGRRFAARAEDHQGIDDAQDQRGDQLRQVAQVAPVDQEILPEDGPDRGGQQALHRSARKRQ